MSLAGIGSYGPGNLTQMLSSLLSRLDNSGSSPSDTSDSASSSQPQTTMGPDANLTGSGKPSLSGMILGTLIGLQNENNPTSSGTAASSDPVQNLFTAMDGNSDGNVSQSELESYLGQFGGTTQQADALYSLLNQSGSSSGISEQDLASQAPPPGRHHGGHHHAQAAQSSDSASSQLLSLLDTDNDGSVSQSEFSDFVTAHGGTQSVASSEFAALDSSNTGSHTASDFSSALDKLQTSTGSDPYAPVMSLLGALAQTGSSVSLSA